VHGIAQPDFGIGQPGGKPRPQPLATTSARTGCGTVAQMPSMISVMRAEAISKMVSGRLTLGKAMIAAV
jgi:hypothetical protein